MAVRVTVEDTDTGIRQTTDVDDYILIVAEPCHLARRQAHRNGTHVLTVKGATRPPYVLDETFEPQEAT